MVKTPNFEVTGAFGALSEKRPVRPEAIRITEGAEVDLRYEGKTVAVRVTRVVEPQTEFEGTILGFDRDEVEHADLKLGDVVRFSYDEIEHIFRFIEADQPEVVNPSV